MNQAAIFAILRDGRARLHLLDRDRLAVTPKGVLDDDLRAALRANKTALLAMLPSCPPRDHRDSCDGTCDDAGSGTIVRHRPFYAVAEPTTARSTSFVDYDAIHSALAAGGATAQDLVPLGHHAALNGFWVAEELTWLDRRCDRLAHARADELTYRAAVLLLVARINELRRWAEGTAPAVAPRPLQVTTNAPVLGPVSLPDGTLVENVGRFIGRLLTAVDYVLSPPVTEETSVLKIYLEQLAILGISARVEVIER